MKRILLIMMALALVIGLIPVTGVFANDIEPVVVGGYAFIPNAEEASVSKVDLAADPPAEVARYSTVQPRSGAVYAYDKYRVSRLAMDPQGNAWALNSMTGKDYDIANAQGQVVRISAWPVAGEVPGVTTSNSGGYAGMLDSDVRVTAFDVGDPGDCPRTINIVEEGGNLYLWIGFYMGEYFEKFAYNHLTNELTSTGDMISVAPYTAYTAVIDGNGILWGVSRNASPYPSPSGQAGVFYFDTNDLAAGVTALPYDLPGKSGENPYAIMLKSDGTVWVSDGSNWGTNQARYFAVYTWGTPVTVEYVNTGVASHAMRGFMEDEEGNIWATTINGLVIKLTWTGAAWSGAIMISGLGELTGLGADALGWFWVIRYGSDQMTRFDPATPSPVDVSVPLGDGPYAYGGFTQYFQPDPKIDIEKHTNGEDADLPTGPQIPVGGNVTWTYYVTNIGNVPLVNIVVTDDNGTPGDTGDDFNPTPIEVGGYNVGDLNQDGILDPAETWLYEASGTAEAGQYANIADVIGTWEGPDGDVPVTDEDPSHYIAPLYQICGYKYSEWDGGLIPLPLWEIILEKWDGEAFVSHNSTTTDADGHYCFTELEPGTYRVSEVLKDGWEQISPAGNEHIVILPDDTSLCLEPGVHYIAQPDAAYIASTNLIDISGLEINTEYGFITDGTLTVTFDNDMRFGKVPSGWASWGTPPAVEEAEPYVLKASNMPFPNSRTLTLSEPVSVFGFELEPNVHFLHDVDVEFILSSGPDVIGTISSQITPGQLQAQLFAIQVGGATFDSIAISVDSVDPQETANGFAIAQVRYAFENPYDFVNAPRLVCYDETAWAYGEDESLGGDEGDVAKHNNKIPGNPSDAWGWTNNFTSETEFPYVMDLWAAAGQNDLSKGFKVGTVTVDYDGDCVTVTYDLDAPYTLAEAHVWVGETPLPTWQVTTPGKGKKAPPVTTDVSTSAPGQFSKYVTYDSVMMGDHSAEFVVCDVDAPFWVAAHAVVEWCEYEPGVLMFQTFEQPGDRNYLADTTLIDISGLTDMSDYGSITDSTLTVSFATDMTKGVVPTHWGTWACPPWTEECQPDVLFTFATTQTLMLSEPCTIFGFELEPNQMSPHQFDVDFILSYGSAVLGTITKTVDGSAGARLFAAEVYGLTFDKIEIVGPAASNGFAIAQVRYALASP